MNKFSTEIPENVFFLMGCAYHKGYWSVVALHKHSYAWYNASILFSIVGKGSSIQDAINKATEYLKWTGSYGALTFYGWTLGSGGVDLNELIIDNDWVKAIIDPFPNKTNLASREALTGAYALISMVDNQHPWVKELQEKGLTITFNEGIQEQSLPKS